MQRLALVLAFVSGCGVGGTTPRGDAGMDADLRDHDAAVLPDMGRDAVVVRDMGSDVSDVGPDAWLATDAGPWFEPECILDALTGAPNGTFPIPMNTSSAGSATFTICPTANPSASPPICTGEDHWVDAALAVTIAGTQITLTGTLPFRVADAPTTVALGICSPMITLALDGDASCPAGALEALPVSIALTFDPTRGNALQLQHVVDDTGVSSNLASATQTCGVIACTGSCCVSDACHCALASLDLTSVRHTFDSLVHDALLTSLTSQVEHRLCATTAGGPCPAGTSGDIDGICRYASDNACAPGPAVFTATHCGP